MQHGDMVVTYWSPDCHTPTTHMPRERPSDAHQERVYRRVDPKGWWTLEGSPKGLHGFSMVPKAPAMEISAPTCNQCGRPQPATAELRPYATSP